MSQLSLALDTLPAPGAQVAAPEEPESLLDLLPDADGAFEFAFGAMVWAEEAIAQMSQEHPERSELLHRAFVGLRPRFGLFHRRATERVIRAHMDELLRRVVDSGADADLGSGTAAEGVCVLSELSLSAPLKHRYFVAAAVFFQDAFGPEVAGPILGEEMVRRTDEDRDQHLIAEILADVRHKVSDEERQRAWKEATP